MSLLRNYFLCVLEDNPGYRYSVFTTCKEFKSFAEADNYFYTHHKTKRTSILCGWTFTPNFINTFLLERKLSQIFKERIYVSIEN